MLEHSRTMARLRRQQQRVLTDSLESDFLELYVSSNYLKLALNATDSNKPLPRSEVDKLCQEAAEHSLESLSSNIPTARSQELKNASANGRVNLPQAHYIPNLRVDEVTSIHLAASLGSRREASSFSPERRKAGLFWTAECIKDFITELIIDELPSVLVSNVLLDNFGDNDLASRLNITEEQKKKLMKVVPQLQSDISKLLAYQRAANLLFSDAWLSFPKTDAFLEQVRDTITNDQFNKLVIWSIQNEAQISNLKLAPSVASNVHN